jgi:hypothetical protein
MRLIAVIVAAVLVVPAWSQELPKPGPEHKVLKAMVGTWESTMKVGGRETKGTMTYKMELGGMWLAGSLKSELFGAAFLGKSLDSYNPIKKKYVSLWVDSMSTAPVIMEGTYDKEKKTMSMSGEGPGMDGKAIKYRSVTKMPDADTMEMTMYMGDVKEPAFSVTYKRKK